MQYVVLDFNTIVPQNNLICFDLFSIYIASIPIDGLFYAAIQYLSLVSQCRRSQLIMDTKSSEIFLFEAWNLELTCCGGGARWYIVHACITTRNVIGNDLNPQLFFRFTWELTG